MRVFAFGFDDATYALANVRLSPPLCSQDNRLTLCRQLCAIASSILWHLAVITGLGQRIAFVSSGNVNRFFKVSRNPSAVDVLLTILSQFEYAAQFAEVVAMLCAKAAFALILDRVAPRQQRAKIAISSIGAWALCVYARLPVSSTSPMSYLPSGSLQRCGRMDRRDGIFIIILLGLRVWYGHNYNGCSWSAGNSILVPAIAEINMMHLFLDNFDQTRTLTVSLAVLHVANEMLFRCRHQPRNPQPVRVQSLVSAVEATDSPTSGLPFTSQLWTLQFPA